jgi:DNA-binding NtrC family response regulator
MQGTDASSTPSASPLSALIVDPDDRYAASAAAVLADAGFTVSVTDNYEDAKTLLVTQSPLVVVTEVRLRAFNGLQLALRAASMTPRVAVVVACGVYDPVLHRDAEAAGATFAVKPLSGGELLAAVYRTAARKPMPDGAVEPVRPPFERRRADRRHAVRGDVAPERRQAQRRHDIARLLRRTLSVF